MSTTILEEKALISASGHLLFICPSVNWEDWTNSPHKSNISTAMLNTATQFPMK